MENEKKPPIDISHLTPRNRWLFEFYRREVEKQIGRRLTEAELPWHLENFLTHMRRWKSPE
ncbi:hypothetical protein LJC34_06595 [Oscillospiraceae bacterium OttesenSCG-928-G22]|nr:hypothetical protein [Oscillospiraceae bacterium OttesenSCG-928-G22]